MRRTSSISHRCADSARRDSPAYNSAMLTGKTALITGSSSGIGLGVARSFVAHGAKVVTTSERPRAEVPAVDGTVYIQADLLRDGEAERLVAESWQALGSIDILVNNLGTYRETSFLELTREHFD